MAEEEYKIWWDEENRLICLKIPKILSEERLKQMIQELIPLLKQASGKVKIYVDLSITEPHLTRAVKTRKEILNIIKAVQKIGFEKVALFTKNIVIKTVVSFILSAGKFENLKFFTTEEEALKWLKEGA